MLQALTQQQQKDEAELCAAAAHLLVKHAVQRVVQQEQAELLQQVLS